MKYTLEPESDHLNVVAGCFGAEQIDNEDYSFMWLYGELQVSHSQSNVMFDSTNGHGDHSQKHGNKVASLRALPIRGSRIEPITSVHDLAVQSQALFNIKDSNKCTVQVPVYWRIKYNGTFPEDVVVIVSIVILIGLFSIQSFGTAKWDSYLLCLWLFGSSSVTELQDGSTLFITVAKYLSPSRHDINQAGITPDVQCTTDMLTSTRGLSSKDNEGTSSSLEADSCIMVAEHELEMQESKGSAS
ncbi:hypothetical protein Syun_009708 [Stephania yunnanensis]|uniref:Tail specific protease domain-containing protein n=1 Tax=Stephania yunnanensis TaxID=152371 RepID=A0AAP0KGX3_9MAGN